MKFCKLENDGKILNITEVADTDTQNPQTSSFDESIGIKFCKKITGWASWIADTPERKGRAVIDGSYDQEKNVFVDIQPFSSCTFNYSTGKWEPPVSFPDADPYAKYNWNESNQTWEAWS